MILYLHSSRADAIHAAAQSLRETVEGNDVLRAYVEWIAADHCYQTTLGDAPVVVDLSDWVPEIARTAGVDLVV